MHPPAKQTPCQSPEWIFWDWNGTLINDAFLCLESLNNLLNRHNLPPIDMLAYKSGFDFPVYRFYESLGFALSAEGFEEISLAFHAHYEKHRGTCQLQAGAEKVLAALQAAGFRQAILSAHEQGRLSATIRDFGLSRFFQEICGTDNIQGRSKLENGRHLLERLGVDRQRCWLVGDTVHDFEVAGELGIRCILFSGGHFNRERLLSTGAPVVDNLGEVLCRIQPRVV